MYIEWLNMKCSTLVLNTGTLIQWGDNCGSESSTLETDVCVWRYALLVVHATQEEEGDTNTFN